MTSVPTSSNPGDAEYAYAEDIKADNYEPVVDVDRSKDVYYTSLKGTQGSAKVRSLWILNTLHKKENNHDG